MKAKFANAKKLSEVNVKDYDAIFYVGGHGPVIDLASDPINAQLASEVCYLFDSRIEIGVEDRVYATSSSVPERSPRLFATVLRQYNHEILHRINKLKTIWQCTCRSN